MLFLVLAVYYFIKIVKFFILIIRVWFFNIPILICYAFFDSVRQAYFIIKHLEEYIQIKDESFIENVKDKPFFRSKKKMTSTLVMSKDHSNLVPITKKMIMKEEFEKEYEIGFQNQFEVTNIYYFIIDFIKLIIYFITMLIMPFFLNLVIIKNNSINFDNNYILFFIYSYDNFIQDPNLINTIFTVNIEYIRYTVKFIYPIVYFYILYIFGIFLYFIKNANYKNYFINFLKEEYWNYLGFWFGLYAYIICIPYLLYYNLFYIINIIIIIIGSIFLKINIMYIINTEFFNIFTIKTGLFLKFNKNVIFYNSIFAKIILFIHIVKEQFKDRLRFIFTVL